MGMKKLVMIVILFCKRLLQFWTLNFQFNTKNCIYLLPIMGIGLPIHSEMDNTE